jgi:hypothetical protein
MDNIWYPQTDQERAVQNMFDDLTKRHAGEEINFAELFCEFIKVYEGAGK